jgi:hypothetical protein
LFWNLRMSLLYESTAAACGKASDIIK